VKRLIALGISIGVLAGLFTWFAGSVPAIGGWKTPFVVWVAFAAWACFYAAGGRRPGLVKTLAANVVGAVWGWLIVQAVGHTSSSPLVLGAFVAVAAFAMCIQAAWSPLGFIPGAFVGAAAFFGTSGLFWSTVASLVVGGLLAFVSELLGDVIERTLLHAPVPAVEHPPVSAA
jgi:hypothetical protein